MTDPSRDEVIRKMRTAKTPEKIAEAEDAVTAWLREHPDDMQIRGEAEGLEMMASALRLLEGKERTA